MFMLELATVKCYQMTVVIILALFHRLSQWAYPGSWLGFNNEKRPQTTEDMV